MYRFIVICILPAPVALVALFVASAALLGPFASHGFEGVVGLLAGLGALVIPQKSLINTPSLSRPPQSTET